MHILWWGCSHGIITNLYYSSGARFAESGNIVINHLVHGGMPVIDRKPVGGDNDDEHHSKLVHRQHKNDTNNDALPISTSNPIGSTVVVQ